jgi:hypothetical protein
MTRHLLIACMLACSFAFAGCPSDDENNADSGSASADDAGATKDAAIDETKTDAGNGGSDKDAGSANGGDKDAGDETTADAGSGTEDVPAPGKATMEATFSKPVGGYKGSLDPFMGLEEDSSADAKGAFTTATLNGQSIRRTLTINLLEMPVDGTTYELGSGSGILKSSATLQQLNAATAAAESYNCLGQVTFDSIDGKVQRFHFELDCLNMAAAKTDGVTVTGSGIATVP